MAGTNMVTTFSIKRRSAMKQRFCLYNRIPFSVETILSERNTFILLIRNHIF